MQRLDGGREGLHAAHGAADEDAAAHAVQRLQPAVRPRDPRRRQSLANGMTQDSGDQRGSKERRALRIVMALQKLNKVTSRGARAWDRQQSIPASAGCWSSKTVRICSSLTHHATVDEQTSAASETSSR